MHLGLESSAIFLKKSIESVDSLHTFINDGLLEVNSVTLSNVAQKLKNNKLAFIVKGLYRLFKAPIKRNLLSSKPSLHLFDFIV